MERYDVAIAGGGPAGSALALVLARAGRRVLLANAAGSEIFRVGEGFAPAGHSLLRELGVLERFLADGHRISYGTVSAWGSAELHATDFIFSLQGRAYQLDRARFDAMLRQAARQAGAELREGVRLEIVDEACDLDRMRFYLRGVEDGEACDCAWLVDASGRSAGIARAQGGVRLSQDCLLAFWTLLQSSERRDSDGRTLVEACPDGWWYSVLLPSGDRLAAYLTDADLADRPALLSKDGFYAKLASTVHLRALCAEHGYVIRQKPRGADASTARLDRFVGPGWLAVGDAALSFDPLSSQGMLNALHTGIRAGQALNAALSGDQAALDAYDEHLMRIYAAYLSNRAMFYGDEKRWEQKLFWARRQLAGMKR